MRVSTIAPVVVRVLMGGLFLLSGSNKLLGFLPVPPMPPAAEGLMQAMVATGYMMPLLGLTESVFGALLIVGRFMPLSLTVLAPIIINIAFFHTVLAPAAGVVLFLLGAEIYLAWVYRDAFRAVLEAVPARSISDAAPERATLARARADL